MEIHGSELGELKAIIKKELAAIYPVKELDSIINVLFSHLTGLSKAEMVLERSRQLTETEIFFLQRAVKRLKRFEPIQYITGVAHFRGLEFKVDPRVLIPRPETEELVSWVLEELDAGTPLKILDIGTGSGCIAISVKCEVPQCLVHAIDISGDALELAWENSSLMKADIIFEERDILNETACSSLPQFDVIISNPPYVTPSDKKNMQKNVIDHEPGLALFVKESDPLLYYREIIAFSSHHLAGGGKIFFECNESNAKEVAGLLKQSGFSDIQLRNDMQGKDRLLMGTG